MVGSTPGVWSPTHEDDDDDVIEDINIESAPEIIELSTPEMEFDNEEWFDFYDDSGDLLYNDIGGEHPTNYWTLDGIPIYDWYSMGPNGDDLGTHVDSMESMGEEEEVEELENEEEYSDIATNECLSDLDFDPKNP
ncbi:unnamed protein product [Linum trigynum]|uniref:Uncharacterized protein n=1 Tax=Linum trigynum TaxID=586398 RepID=A0AAV2GBU5_9ROSI